MFKLKILLAALVAVSFLTLPGCVWSKSSSAVKTSYETSLESSDSAVLSKQADSTFAAADRTDTAISDSTQIPTTAGAVIESTFSTEAAPITAESIAALPAGTIVDEFLNSEEIISGCFYYE